MLCLISACVLLLIGCGLYVRKRNHRLHYSLMLAAFAIDLSLVLYLELLRGAVEKVASSGSSLLWFHAGISAAALLCYPALIFLGAGLLRGREANRRWHRSVGLIFCVLRMLNFATSFAV